MRLNPDDPFTVHPVVGALYEVRTDAADRRFILQMVVAMRYTRGDVARIETIWQKYVGSLRLPKPNWTRARV